MNAMNSKSHRNQNAMCVCAYIDVCIFCVRFISIRYCCCRRCCCCHHHVWLFEPTSVYRLQIDVLIVKDESPHYVAQKWNRIKA